MALRLLLTLPLPPGVNNQYVTVNGRRVLSPEARRYKRGVLRLLRRKGLLPEDLAEAGLEEDGDLLGQWQAAALVGLLPDQRALLLVYGPALLLFGVVASLLGGRPALWPDLLLALAVPMLAFAIGRLLRLARLQCGFGAPATMAVAFGFVLAYGLARALERVVGLA